MEEFFDVSKVLAKKQKNNKVHNEYSATLTLLHIFN